jgi:hypothetical protein
MVLQMLCEKRTAGKVSHTTVAIKRYVLSAEFPRRRPFNGNVIQCVFFDLEITEHSKTNNLHTRHQKIVSMRLLIHLVLSSRISLHLHSQKYCNSDTS